MLTGCQDIGIPSSAPRHSRSIVHSGPQASFVSRIGLQKPDRQPLGIIKRAWLQRVAAGQRRQQLARDAALPKVQGQGGADHGPAAVPDDSVAHSQDADHRRLPRPGLL
jgi:hypothetical protein